MIITNNNFKIAREYRVAHWKNLREKLPIDNNPQNECWAKAFRIFEIRVKTRFLNPIDTILNMNPKKGKGEGFSAVALQCILIEFFEAFYQGKIYSRKEQKYLGKDEYNSSRELYVSFLENRSPFDKFFDRTNNWANYFYEDIRCGLLHGAATKDRVIIRAVEKDLNGNVSDPTHEKIIGKKENGDVILYRTPFQKALKKHLQDYEEKLMSSGELKENFRRKMDELCQIPTP